MHTDHQARLDARLNAYLQSHGEPPAPWVRFPEYQAMSVAWRMGGGEDCLDLWRAYIGRLDSTAARLAYLQKTPPAPRDWTNTLLSFISQQPYPELSDRQRADALAQLDAVTALANDAAYPLWVSKCEAAGGVRAPWSTLPPLGDDSPMDYVFRYELRELTWWARWCHEQPSLSEWLLHQEPAEGPWEEVVASMLERRAPAARTTSHHLVCELAATAELAPPWTYGAPPWEDDHSFDDDAPAADKWGCWSLHVFDDAASWQTYLTPWSPPPAAWQPALETHLCWLT